MPRPRAFRLGGMASLFANGVDPARAVGAVEASFIQFPLEPRPTDGQCNVVSDAKKVSAHPSIAVAEDTSTPQLRQDESAATGEERNEGKDGDHEQHRVDDHTAGDRDDEKNNTENQKHGGRPTRRAGFTTLPPLKIPRRAWWVQRAMKWTRMEPGFQVLLCLPMSGPSSAPV